MKYTIDYNKLIKWLIPIPFFGKRIYAFLRVMIVELKAVYNAMLSQKDNFIYYLTITPQVVYLEKMLNDRYDFFERRIYLLDGRNFDALYIYKKIEEQPVLFYRKSEGSTPIYLYLKSEVGNDASDFVVCVPSVVVFNEAEMKSLINTFKLAGTIYSISII